mmetsp:Transcript_26954/g.79630  ORF Transcript_26954/g.79630 Transcript_26954/m.79630 type:complete len:219 (+) Transcript_26954:866-1522(+)
MLPVVVALSQGGEGGAGVDAVLGRVELLGPQLGEGRGDVEEALDGAGQLPGAPRRRGGAFLLVALLLGGGVRDPRLGHEGVVHVGQLRGEHGCRSDAAELRLQLLAEVLIAHRGGHRRNEALALGRPLLLLPLDAERLPEVSSLGLPQGVQPAQGPVHPPVGRGSVPPRHDEGRRSDHAQGGERRRPGREGPAAHQGGRYNVDCSRGLIRGVREEGIV